MREHLNDNWAHLLGLQEIRPLPFWLGLLLMMLSVLLIICLPACCCFCLPAGPIFATMSDATNYGQPLQCCCHTSMLHTWNAARLLQ